MALPQQRQCCGTSVSAQNRDTGPDRDWPSPHLYRTERKKNPKTEPAKLKDGADSSTRAPADVPVWPRNSVVVLTNARGGARRFQDSKGECKAVPTGTLS